MSVKHHRRYGWKPDVPDMRDYRYRVARRVRLPRRVNLRPQCPPVRDQRELGSCTGFAARGAFAFAARKQGQKFEPSPLFAYYTARAIDGLESVDAGSEIRTVIKAAADSGICAEKLWPYRVNRYATRPPRTAYAQAARHQAIEYLRVESGDLRALRARLAEGFPVAFGFSVYESFERIGRSGLMPLPSQGERVLGGHAVVAVGYDDDTERVACMNQWGRNWGDRGFFQMPYAFAESANCDDWWTVRLVEGRA